MLIVVREGKGVFSGAASRVGPEFGIFRFWGWRGSKEKMNGGVCQKTGLKGKGKPDPVANSKRGRGLCDTWGLWGARYSGDRFAHEPKKGKEGVNKSLGSRKGTPWITGGVFGENRWVKAIALGGRKKHL